MRKKNVLHHGLSFFVAVSLIANTCVYASGSANPDNVPFFHIPASIGKIIKTHKGNPNKPHLLLINDLHCHAQAQKNIAAIIKKAKQHYGNALYVVGVEGSSGYIDTSILKNVPNKKFKETVVNKLLENGYVNGAELYDIMYPKQVVLYGIEDEETYNKNFREFKKGFLEDDAVQKEIIKILRIIDKRKEYFFKGRLKKIEKAHQKYKNQSLSLLKLIDICERITKHYESYKNYKNLDNYVKGMKISNKINMPALNSELKYFVKSIDKHLTVKERDILAKLSKTKDNEYFGFLTRISKNKNIVLQKESFLEFFRFQKSLEYSDSVDELILFGELEKYIYEIKNAVALTQETKDIIFMDRYLGLLKGYLTNSISYRDTEKTEAEEKRFFGLLSEKNIPVKQEIFDKHIAQVRDFYSTAEKRNEILVRNQLSIINEKSSIKNFIPVGANLCVRPSSYTIMIIGGFHAEGIMQILRSKGCGYTNIIPHISDDKGRSREVYLERIQTSKGIPGTPGARALALSTIFYSDANVVEVVMCLWSMLKKKNF